MEFGRPADIPVEWTATSACQSPGWQNAASPVTSRRMRTAHRFVVTRALVREMLPTLLLASGVTTFLLLIRAMFVLADLFISRNVDVPTGLRLLLLGVPNILASRAFRSGFVRPPTRPSSLASMASGSWVLRGR